MNGCRYVLLVVGFACACGGTATREPTPAVPVAPSVGAASTPEVKMSYEFRVLQTPERQLMAIHDQARGGELPQKIKGNLDKVWTYLRANAAKADHSVVVYRDFDRATGVMTIDVGVQVESALPGNGEVVPVTSPGGLVVTTVHLGPYDKLGDASSALHEFCGTHDHPIAGPTWEEYGDWSDDSSKLRTDVFVLVAR
jgi:effector-binding domain-containing protein